jgi:WD40 repeat protein
MQCCFGGQQLSVSRLETSLPAVVGERSVDFPSSVVRLAQETTTYSIAVLREDESVALLASSNTSVQVLRLTTGEIEQAFEGHKAAVNDVVEVRPGLAASCSIDRTIQLFDPTNCTRVETLRGHRGPVYALAADGEQERLLSASGDGSLRLWSCAACCCVHTIKRLPAENDILQNEVYDVEFMSYTSPGLQFAVAATQRGTVELWDLTHGVDTPVTTFSKGVEGEVRCVKVLQPYSSNELLSAGEDHVLRLWDARVGNEPVHEFRLHRDSIWGLATDGRRAVTTSVRGRAIFWDIRTEKYESQLLGFGPFRCVSCAPSRRTYHLGNFYGYVYSVWTAKIPAAPLSDFPENISREEPPCMSNRRFHNRVSKDLHIQEASSVPLRRRTRFQNCRIS